MTAKAKKVLFLDSVHPILEDQLKQLGFTCEHMYNSSRDEISHQLSHYEGVVLRSRIVLDQKLLEKGENLKFILRSGSGLENIDLEFARSKNIACFNSPEGNADAVAEHTLGLLLGLLNNICIANQQVKSGIWLREENRGIELKHRCVGIFGFGHMGKAVAERLSSFACKIMFLDPKVDHDPLARKVEEPEFFDKVDVLLLHADYCSTNYHLINDSFLSRFKHDLYIVNTARGKLVDTEALIKHLQTGKVRGAALDVNEFESHQFLQEGKEYHPALKQLNAFSQVILTPHIAGWTNESYYKLSAVLAKKIKTLYQES